MIGGVMLPEAEISLLCIDSLSVNGDLAPSIADVGLDGLGSTSWCAVSSREAIAILPLSMRLSIGKIICILLLARREAQKTIVTSPAVFLPVRTCQFPNQNPVMNIVRSRNCTKPALKPQSIVILL